MSTLRPLRSTDRALYRLLHRRVRARPVDPIMIAATDVGTKSAAWMAAAVVLACFGDRKARRTAVVSIAATLTAQIFVNILLKPIFRRKRPFAGQQLQSRLLITPPQEHSWPSGHAASSAAAFITLASAYPDRKIPLLVLAVAIAYSRVYVGVHYPFDVAAGTAVGLTVGGAYILAARSVLSED